MSARKKARPREATVSPPRPRNPIRATGSRVCSELVERGAATCDAQACRVRLAHPPFACSMACAWRSARPCAHGCSSSSAVVFRRVAAPVAPAVGPPCVFSSTLARAQCRQVQSLTCRRSPPLAPLQTTLARRVPAVTPACRRRGWRLDQHPLEQIARTLHARHSWSGGAPAAGWADRRWGPPPPPPKRCSCACHCARLRPSHPHVAATAGEVWAAVRERQRRLGDGASACNQRPRQRSSWHVFQVAEPFAGQMADGCCT